MARQQFGEEDKSENWRYNRVAPKGWGFTIDCDPSVVTVPADLERAKLEIEAFKSAVFQTEDGDRGWDDLNGNEKYSVMEDWIDWEGVDKKHRALLHIEHGAIHGLDHRIEFEIEEDAGLHDEEWRKRVEEAHRELLSLDDSDLAFFSGYDPAAMKTAEEGLRESTEIREDRVTLSSEDKLGELPKSDSDRIRDEFKEAARRGSNRSSDRGIELPGKPADKSQSQKSDHERELDEAAARGRLMSRDKDLGPER